MCFALHSMLQLMVFSTGMQWRSRTEMVQKNVVQQRAGGQNRALLVDRRVHARLRGKGPERRCGGGSTESQGTGSEVHRRRFCWCIARIHDSGQAALGWRRSCCHASWCLDTAPQPQALCKAQQVASLQVCGLVDHPVPAAGVADSSRGASLRKGPAGSGQLLSDSKRGHTQSLP